MPMFVRIRHTFIHDNAIRKKKTKNKIKSRETKTSSVEEKTANNLPVKMQTVENKFPFV